VLVVLDNCEHLLDAAAELVVASLAACPGLTLLTTSREPIGVPGEIVWRVPSLSLADEAIDLFTDRAQLAMPGFRVTDDTANTVTEICKRLDGMPLAIELAAARVRALSPAQILESLHDRFRLLTGGGRAAVRRQQTLRASRPNSTWCDSPVKACPTRTSAQGCSSHRARCRPTSPTSTPSSG
jgi:predicted ATPase